MMKARDLACGFVFGFGLLSIVPASHAADLLAGWNFNDFNLTVDHGAGALTAGLTLPAASFGGGGTTVNAYAGDPAGQALSYSVTTLNNAATLTFQFSSTGYGNLILSYASRADSGSFTGIAWEYGTNGLIYSSAGSSQAITSSYVGRSVDLSSFGGGLADMSTVYLRATLTGATATLSPSVFSLDNVQITGQLVPEPRTSVAWCGLLISGYAILARRRFRAMP